MKPPTRSNHPVHIPKKSNACHVQIMRSCHVQLAPLLHCSNRLKSPCCQNFYTEVVQKRLPGLVNLQKNYGKSSCLIDKSTINGNFQQQTVSHCQRVGFESVDFFKHPQLGLKKITVSKVSWNKCSNHQYRYYFPSSISISKIQHLDDLSMFEYPSSTKVSV